ncbi:MAG: LapA family protein [Ilumatobacteraceae bacterium]|nr:LapA family protein [Ilumatobacteraceae bacterium]
MSEDIAENSGAVHRHDFAVLLRWLFLAAIVVALVAVALDNRDKVRVGYAVGDAQAPIGIVMLVAAAAGIIIGWLVRHRPRNRV